MTHPRFEPVTEPRLPAECCWTSPDPEQTRAAARSLAGCIGEEGLVLALIGPLGAGKTLFVKGLAEGLGIEPARVTSPTFVIAAEYPLAQARRLHHVDLYRVESVEELEQAGFLDMLEPGAVVAVEWADRFPHELPGDHLAVTIGRAAQACEGSRSLSVHATGENARLGLERWLKRMPPSGSRLEPSSPGHGEGE